MCVEGDSAVDPDSVSKVSLRASSLSPSLPAVFLTDVNRQTSGRTNLNRPRPGALGAV